LLLVDTSVLLAAAEDPDHEACAQTLQAAESLVTTPLVVAETAYLIGRQLGAPAEARFFRSVAGGELRIEMITAIDAERIAELIETYADLGLGGTDASLIATAERLGIQQVATLDRRHFSVVRPIHVTTFALIP